MANSNAKVKVAREIWASVTERGQVTIPAEVRKALGLSKRGNVIFRVEDGAVVLEKAPFSSVAELAGSIPALKEPKSWEEIEEIVDQERAEAYLQKMREGRA